MTRSLIAPLIIVALLIGAFFYFKPFTPTLEECQEIAQEGKTKEALTIINKLIYDDSNSELLIIQRGIFKTELNDQRGAIADFNRALKNNSKSDAARLYRAYSYYLLSEFEKAMSDLDYVLEVKRKGTDVPMWTEKLGIDEDLFVSMQDISFYHGLVCLEIERYQEAYDDFSTCINHQFNLADSYFGRGQALIRLNNNDRACSDLKESMKLGHVSAKELIN